jgi:hypothetical protein
LGHRPVRTSGDVSLFDAMGTSHFALNQVQNVLRRERVDLDEASTPFGVLPTKGGDNL